jgi:ParB-like chromosome segregation protein Spo0J
MKDPIDLIEWREASELNANDYNPNIVFNAELKLLERSVLLTGWVQPILIDRDGNIIDGFHRWRLAQDSKRMRAKYKGRVPVAVINVERHSAMMMTIRMNRAKGTHVALRMQDIVRELLDTHHCDKQEVANEIGATLKEVDLLYQSSIFKAKGMEKYRYSKAWAPVPEQRGSM